MKKNKRLVVSIFVMLLFIVVISMIFIFVSKKDNTVVDNVEIMKIDVSNKTYINGVVEPLETENIYLDDSKGIVSEVLVTDGQNIGVNDALFIYKNEDIIKEIDDHKKEIENNNSKIVTLQKKKSEVENIVKSKECDVDSTSGNTEDIDKRQEEVLMYNEEISTYDEQIQSLNELIIDIENKISSLSKDIYTKVLSKIEGVVSIVGSTEDYTKPYMNINSNNLCIKGSISEKDLSSVKKGQEVDILILATSQDKKGVISKISGEPITSNDETDGGSLSRYIVTISFDSTEDICSGYHVQAVANKNSEEIVVPKSAIVTDNHKEYVLAIIDGKIEKKMVKCNIKDDNAIIISGLVNGDYIVTNPSKGMKEGMIIEKYNRIN